MIVKMKHNDIADDVVAIFLTCHDTVQNVEVNVAVERKTSLHSDTSATKGVLFPICCILGSPHPHAAINMV